MQIKQAPFSKGDIPLRTAALTSSYLFIQVGEKVVCFTYSPLEARGQIYATPASLQI